MFPRFLRPTRPPLLLVHCITLLHGSASLSPAQEELVEKVAPKEPPTREVTGRGPECLYVLVEVREDKEEEEVEIGKLPAWGWLLGETLVREGGVERELECLLVMEEE